MDMSVYKQPNCINGVNKENIDQLKNDVDTVKVLSDDNKTRITAIETTIENNTDYFGKWTLYFTRDWSDLVDSSGSIPVWKQDVIIKIDYSGPSNNFYAQIFRMQGTRVTDVSSAMSLSYLEDDEEYELASITGFPSNFIGDSNFLQDIVFFKELSGWGMTAIRLTKNTDIRIYIRVQQ